MWSLIFSLLLFSTTVIAQNVTIPSSDSRIQLAGAGWHSVNAPACGTTSQTMQVTGNAGDTMTFRFQGAGQLTVFGSTSSNGASVQFQLDAQSSIVDLSELQGSSQDLCFPIFTVNGLSGSEVHTLTATHGGVGRNPISQGDGLFGITRVVLLSPSASSPIPSSIEKNLASSTTQHPVNSAIPSPGLNAATTPSASSLPTKSKSNAGLIVGVIFLLLALTALSVAVYFFWRKREERRKQTAETIVIPPPRIDSIGDPDIVGIDRKQVSFNQFNDKEELFSEKKVMPGTLPRALLQNHPRESSISTPDFKLNPPRYSRLETRRSNALAHTSAKVEESMEEREVLPEEQNVTGIAQKGVHESRQQDLPKEHGAQEVEQANLTTPSQNSIKSAPLMITSAEQFPYPPPPLPETLLTAAGSIPVSLKPGNAGVPQINIEIPSENADGKKRPVSVASSWRTVGTPYTPYAAVVAFSTREVMRAEQPLFSWNASGPLEKGQAL